MYSLVRQQILICGVFLILFSGGCASFGDKPGTVILQHPETMEFVNCEVDRWGTAESYTANEQCVKDYQAQGYVVWGER